MTATGSRFGRFFAELRRRRVFRAAFIYLVVAWLMVQVAETTFPSLDLPEWSTTLIIAVVAVCFPIVLVLAWAYDLKPTGEKMIVRTPGPEAESADVGVAVRDKRIRSLAVLPFADLSPDGDQEYFGDGLAEELLTTITSCCPGRIRVPARTSSFAFKGMNLDVREIGARLGVDAVVEGSVRKAGDRLRISVQLIDVRDGFHIWSERYDRGMDDLFAIQDEIANSVAEAINLPGKPRPQAERATPSDVRAYEFYLQGRHAFNKLTRRSLHTACALFGRAIEIDPEFARAYAGLTDVYFYLYNYWEPREEYIQRADEASRTALEICPEIAEAHIARGQALSLLGAEEAKDEFERAIALDPSLFEAYFCAARFHYARGEAEEAARLFRKAHNVRPDEYQALVLGSNALRRLDRVEEAERTQVEALKAIEAHLELYSDDARAYYLGASIWRFSDRPDKAQEWLDKALTLEPDDAAVHYNVACYYARIPEAERAFEHLGRAIELGFRHRAWVENDPDFDQLRTDPRFSALLARLR